MKALFAALAVAASFGSAAMAGPAPLSGDDCVLVQDIRNHTVVDQNTMLMEVFGKGVYRVTTAQACFRSAISADPIAFNTRGRERICKASQLGLHARSGYCGAQSIERLTAEQVAALPKALKP
jgi:hypothetical protein